MSTCWRGRHGAPASMGLKRCRSRFISLIEGQALIHIGHDNTTTSNAGKTIMKATQSECVGVGGISVLFVAINSPLIQWPLMPSLVRVSATSGSA